MSLFSGLGQNKPPGSSLFGQPATTNAQTGGGLFGSAPAAGLTGEAAGAASSSSQQQQFSTSLFPSLGQTGQQKQSTQQPASNSLFGGSGALGLQSQANNPQASSGNSLFGGAGSGAFGSGGGGGGGTSQPAGPSGVFGASILGNSTNQQSSLGQQQQQQQQQANQQSQSGPVDSQPAYFNHLLERGKKRVNQNKDAQQLGELPSLQLGLGDIARKVRDLGSGNAASQPSRGVDTRGHHLLAASGVTTGATLRDLKSFSSKAGLSPLPTTTEATDPDLDTYFANAQAKSTQALIEDALEQSKRDFDAFLEERVQMNWEEQRRKIYEHFGLARRSASGNADQSTTGRGGAFSRSRRGRAVDPSRPLNGSSFGATGLSKSVIGTGSTGPGRAIVFSDASDKVNGNGQLPRSDDRFVRDKEEKLATKVKELNMARLGQSHYPVIQNFRDVEVQLGYDNSERLIDAYNTLIEITKESPGTTESLGTAVSKERQYLSQYIDESIKMRKRILQGSLTSLEKAFFKELETEITRNPGEANIGGIPTPINKIRAYIRLRLARKELGSDSVTLQTLGNDYCWVLIFYLLRSGYVNEAARYVSENERAIKNMDRNFPTYLTCYVNDPDRRLTPTLQTKINTEYQSRTRNAPENSLDPYRIACFKVIGRCDLSRRSMEGVNQTMEDWVWLQFALAREVNRAEEVRGEVFGLEDLRNVINDIGQRHFKDNQSEGEFTTFFYLQILAGMFERAIAYLYSHNYITAVHFAIALSYHGLLRVSDFNVADSDLLTHTTQGKPQISFGRMVGYYTRDFRAALPEAATDYLCLICMNADLAGQAGRSYRDLCHEALRELVLETREFAMLLGDIRADGQRIKGVIEQRLQLIKLTGEDEFLKTITVQAAQVADESGRITDAVLLYHLAEEYDNVIELINRALSDAVAVDIGEEHMRIEPSKPRALADGSNGQQQQQQQQQQEQEQNFGISLTSVDDPAVLARNMIGVYDKNALYLRKIKQVNRDACGLLLRMNNARLNIEAGRWADALDVIHSLNLLPLTTNTNTNTSSSSSSSSTNPANSNSNSLPIIRNAANAFNTLPHVIARNIGNLLMWTVTACVRQREILLSSAFEDSTRAHMADVLLQTAKNLMVFAGLLRYKLPPKVFEALARAGQDVDGGF